MKIQQTDGAFKTVSRTILAGRYPDALCEAWARLLKPYAPQGARTRDDGMQDDFTRDLSNAARRSPQAPEEQRPGSAAVEAVDQRGSSEFYRLIGDELAAFPDFLEDIVFGQHSEAEKEAKRHRSQQSRRRRRSHRGGHHPPEAASGAQASRA